MSAGAHRTDAWRREAVLGLYAERPLHAPPKAKVIFPPRPDR